MKWEKVKLSEVTEYITDGDHQPAPKSDSGVLFVKIKDIQDNRLTFDNALFVPQEYYNRLPKNRKAEYGDTLYTVVGSYGIPAFVNHNIPFCFERNIALLHPNNRVIPKYLYYAVNNPTSDENGIRHGGIDFTSVPAGDAKYMLVSCSEKPKQYNQYYHYTERSIPLVELAKGDPVSDELLFQYVLLIAVPFSNSRTFTGIQSSADYIEVDLRQALPSTFLRPHAQHGLVLRRKVHHPTDYGTDAYDMAPAVIGIIKIRIDKVHEWMGNGELLTQNNLFPPPAYDYGFDLLLSRDDLFKDSEYSIAKYV